MTYNFSSVLWETESMGAWVFVTVPTEPSEEIRSMPWPPAPGFGSLRVRVTMGGSSWATSIFPESVSSCFVLPVKKAVRRAEGVAVGDTVSIALDLVDKP